MPFWPPTVVLIPYGLLSFSLLLATVLINAHNPSNERESRESENYILELYLLLEGTMLAVRVIDAYGQLSAMELLRMIQVPSISLCNSTMMPNSSTAKS